MAAEAHGAGHPAGVFVRSQGRHPRGQHAEHRLAQPQLDGGGRAPDHADRRTTAEIDHFGEIQLQPQVLGGHGRHEHRSLMKLRAVNHQPVEVCCTQPGILQRLGCQIGDLLQMKHPRRSGVFFRLVLGGTNDRRVTFQTHGFPTYR
ncbi:hypothetical protein D3C84_123930 [compost metagenome]